MGYTNGFFGMFTKEGNDKVHAIVHDALFLPEKERQPHALAKLKELAQTKGFEEANDSEVIATVRVSTTCKGEYEVWRKQVSVEETEAYENHLEAKIDQYTKEIDNDTQGAMFILFAAKGAQIEFCDAYDDRKDAEMAKFDAALEAKIDQEAGVHFFIQKTEGYTKV